MNNRLENLEKVICYGNEEWKFKPDLCKFKTIYNNIDCIYIQGSRFCYNTEMNKAEVKMCEKIYNQNE